jgi:hypothetical protein
MLSLVLMGFVTGAIVQWWGYYTPFIILGSAIFTVGAGLMTLLTVNTTNWTAYGYTIVAGAGCGFALQNAYMSVQAVLPQATLPIGNAVVMFSQTLSYFPSPPSLPSLRLTGSGAIFLAISNSVLSNGLVDQISARIPSVDPAAIVGAGATGVRGIVSPDLLPLVLEAYNTAVRHVFIMGIVVGALGFMVSFGFEWKSIKGKNLAAGMA